jgi:hypothetical protein
MCDMHIKWHLVILVSYHDNKMTLTSHQLMLEQLGFVKEPNVRSMIKGNLLFLCADTMVITSIFLVQASLDGNHSIHGSLSLSSKIDEAQNEAYLQKKKSCEAQHQKEIISTQKLLRYGLHE